MNYKISESEHITTSTGKAKINTNLITEEGEPVRGVSIWSDFPNFANLKEGEIVVGDLVPSKDPKWGPTLYPPKPATPTRSAGAITKAMEKKEASIEKFQDNKEQAVKVASTFGKAVDCAIAEYEKDKTDLSSLEELIRKWRKQLWFLYDEYTDYPPFLK